jgi:hypothetical protein
MVHDNKINTTHSIAKININRWGEEIIVKHIMIVEEGLLHCHQVQKILRNQMLSVLREVTSAATGGPRATQLVEDYPCQMTMREYHQSLPQSWVVEIPEFGPIKDQIRFGEHEKFTGDRLS